MKYQLAPSARPQVKALLLAALLSVALWFIPFAEVAVYPFRLFVTFIHEGGHILATLLTGNSVQSLTINADGSGEVISSVSGLFSGLLISSAGYLGAMSFGAVLLVLIRRTVAARIVLMTSAGFVVLMTLLYGLFGSPFTVVAGLLLAGALFAVGKYASAKTANFLVALLAVQCVLNALMDLKTVFELSSPFGGYAVHTDAANMAAATGIPAIVWALLWVVIGFGILLIALRVYAIKRTAPMQHELPFEDTVDDYDSYVDPKDSLDDSRAM